jgi:hypothetical protein
MSLDSPVNKTSISAPFVIELSHQAGRMIARLAPPLNLKLKGPYCSFDDRILKKRFRNNLVSLGLTI